MWQKRHGQWLSLESKEGGREGQKKKKKGHIIMEHPNPAPFQKPCLMTSSYQATEHSRTSFPELAPLLSALNKRLLYTQSDMYRWHHKRRTHKSWIPRTETPKHLIDSSMGPITSFFKNILSVSPDGIIIYIRSSYSTKPIRTLGPGRNKIYSRMIN